MIGNHGKYVKINKLFFRAVLESQQNWAENTKFPYTPVPTLRCIPYTASEWYICNNLWTYIDTSLSLKAHSLH